ncbi:MAG: VTT domain-containing protein [Steroidobacteraceae bacterium]
MLGAITRSVVTFAGAHQSIAYGLILLVSLAESLPVVGAFVPGDAIIFAVSALVPTGALRLWPLVLAAFAGAVLGDGLAFWLGRHYHATLLGRWPFRGRPRLVARGAAFLERHGGKSVFAARFTPGVRAIVPVLSGVLYMDAARFYLMNLLSALLWAPAHILAGAAIGASFVLLGAVAGRLALMAGIVLVLLGLLYLLMRYLLRRAAPHALAAQERVRAWAARRTGWFARQLLAVLDPTRREMPGLAVLGAIVLSSLWLFFGVLQDVIAGDPLVRANQAVFHFLQGLRTEWVDQVMVGITELADTGVVVAVALAALTWLAWRRNWRAAAHLVSVVAIAGIATVVLKIALHVHRPEPIDTGWDAFAFPSGHSAASAALYSFLAIISAWEAKGRWRLPITVVIAVLIGAIDLSRVYLGAHWLSDVLAGTAFGIAAAALLAIAYLRHDPPRVGATGLCVSAGLALLLVGGIHIAQRHTFDMRRYAVHRQVQMMSLAAWWQRGWMRQPAHRIDLIGGAEQPLTFQWAGRRAVLQRELASHGWLRPPRWTLRTAARWFEPHIALSDLPVLPHLQSGHREALVMVHGTRNPRERYVLRLWRSGTDLTTSAAAEPLYLGTVVAERLQRVAPIMVLTHARHRYDTPRNVLARALRRERVLARPDIKPQPQWDGCVLLGRPTPGMRREPRTALQSRTSRRRVHQRRAATTDQTASTTPNGQAPCKNP